LIAVIATSLEAILQRPIDKETIGFTQQGSRKPENSMQSLAAAWSPIVDAVLTFLSSTVTAEEFAESYSNEEFLPGKERQISALLYASRNSLNFSELAQRTSR
jgi:hypothetical protein